MKPGPLLFSAAYALAQQYTVSTFAGGAPPPTPVVAVKASIHPTGGMAADDSGNVYFTSDACVFKVDAGGIMTRVAGNSRRGHSGDGGPATSAEIGGAGQVVVDHSGNLYVADAALPNAGAIRKISVDGTIRSVATGLNLLPPAAPPAMHPLAVDQNDNVYFIEGGSIKKLSAEGSVTTLVAYGSATLVAPPLYAYPQSIAVDAAGNLYIGGEVDVDEFTGYNRIWMMTTDGVVHVVAGAPSGGLPPGDGPAISAQLSGAIVAISVDRAGEIFFTDPFDVRKIGADGNITTLQTPGGRLAGFDMTVDASGRVYILGHNERIDSLILTQEANGSLTAIAGGGDGNIGDGGAAVNAPLSSPTGITVDNSHNVYIGESSNRIRKVAPDGTISTVAGNGTFRIPGAPAGDGGAAVSAQLSCVTSSILPAGCRGIAADANGNFYFSDGDRVRKVSADGTITTISNVKAHGLASDGQNLFVADPYGAQILKLAADGSLSVIAGNGTNGRSGDGGPAANAQLFIPVDVALDGTGNIDIAEMYDSRIRKVTTDGTITTIAGGGTLGDGPALATLLAPNLGIAADRQGNVYVAEYDTNRIRKISTTGTIVTIAGDVCVDKARCFGYTGDGGLATSAQLNGPVRLAVDSNGVVYVADRDNDAIRVLRPIQ